jgi:hypothetical protein
MSNQTTPKEPVDDSAIFIDQARWLLQWHNARSESFAGRALAVLGFDGVILALLLQGFGITGIEATESVWLLLLSTTSLLFFSAGWAIATVLPNMVAMPAVRDLRSGWAAHAQTPVARYAGPLVAESFLNASDLSGLSPVAEAKSEGDTRARRFSWAVSSLLAAIVSLGVLGFVLLRQI